MRFIKSMQLWSLKEETEKNFINALQRVVQAGYDAVEFAGYGGLTAEEMKGHLDNFGLKVTGSHVGYPRLKANLEEEIYYNQVIENKYLVLPYYKYETVKDFSTLAEELNRIGEKCAGAGLKLCYHNHKQEFYRYDGKLGMDIILEETKPENLQAEIDTYWVRFTGEDPVEYLSKLKGRCPLLHLKDMEAEGERKNTEVGNGILDFKSIINEAEKIGTEALIVEQGFFRRPVFESMEISIKNLNTLLSGQDDGRT